MTKQCNKIITDKKQIEALGKKTLGERHVIMQSRASKCMKENIRKGR